MRNSIPTKELQEVIKYLNDRINSLHEQFTQGEKYSLAIDELREVHYLLKDLTKR